MSLHRNPAVLLDALGETYTLRKVSVASGTNAWTAGSPTIAYHAQKGHRRIDKPNDAGGLVRDAQAIVVLHPDLTAPAQGDQIAPGTHTSDTGVEWLQIVHVDIVRVEGQLSKYYAWVRE